MTRKKVVAGAIIFLAVVALIGSFKIDTDTSNKVSEGSKVGVINIEGVIMSGSSQDIFGGFPTSQTVMRQIREAADDSSIKSVVLRINSSGGSVAATEEIGRELEKLSKTGKPIVVSMGDTAASGGYWLAAKADKIYANGGTVTGSIGVRMDYQNLEELYDMLGIEQEVIKSGPHKDIGSPLRDLEEEEREMFQEMVDGMYADFINVVAEGRDMPVNEVKDLATGRIWTGSQAKENGLVDEIGNFYDAVDEAAEMGGIEGEPSLKYFKTKNPVETLLGGSLNNLKYTDLIEEMGDGINFRENAPVMLLIP